MAVAPKAKGLLSKKVAGIPLPVILVGGGVAAYWLLTKFRGSASQSATDQAPADTVPGYATGDDSGGGGGGGGGSPTATGTGTGTGTDYTGTGTTNGSTPPIFDTAQPGNPYGQGVAYVEPGVGDLPPGVLPVVYTPPNTTTLSPASGALASNPAQGGHSL